MARLTHLLALAAALLPAAGLAAGTGDPRRDAILAGYAAEARAADPAFAGFSAERGRALYLGPHAGGKPGTPACATCHTPDPKATGRHQKTGRAIDPMAVSANQARFTDAADVAKRFARDCPNVLGRDCTAQEKGDYLAFLAGQ